MPCAFRDIEKNPGRRIGRRAVGHVGGARIVELCKSHIGAAAGVYVVHLDMRGAVCVALYCQHVLLRASSKASLGSVATNIERPLWGNTTCFNGDVSVIPRFQGDGATVVAYEQPYRGRG